MCLCLVNAKSSEHEEYKLNKYSFIVHLAILHGPMIEQQYKTYEYIPFLAGPQ